MNKRNALEIVALWCIVWISLWVAAGITGIGAYCLVWVFLKALYAWGAVGGVLALLTALIFPVSLVLTYAAQRQSVRKATEERAHHTTHTPFSVSSLN